MADGVRVVSGDWTAVMSAITDDVATHHCTPAAAAAAAAGRDE